MATLVTRSIGFNRAAIPIQRVATGISMPQNFRDGCRWRIQPSPFASSKIRSPRRQFLHRTLGDELASRRRSRLEDRLSDWTRIPGLLPSSGAVYRSPFVFVVRHSMIPLDQPIGFPSRIVHRNRRWPGRHTDCERTDRLNQSRCQSQSRCHFLRCNHVARRAVHPENHSKSSIESARAFPAAACASGPVVLWLG